MALKISKRQYILIPILFISCLLVNWAAEKGDMRDSHMSATPNFLPPDLMDPDIGSMCKGSISMSRQTLFAMFLDQATFTYIFKMHQISLKIPRQHCTDISSWILALDKTHSFFLNTKYAWIGLDQGFCSLWADLTF